MMERLDERARQRVGGAAWDAIRPKFEQINEALMSVSDTTTGELTTIYIKYTSAETGSNPFAVLWVKKSTEMTLGLALPENFKSEQISGPARNMKYTGLTGYITIGLDDDVPKEISDWVSAAYAHLSGG